MTTLQQAKQMNPLSPIASNYLYGTETTPGRALTNGQIPTQVARTGEPTVLTSENVTKKIPEIQQKITTATDRGLKVGEDGSITYADGTKVGESSGSLDSSQMKALGITDTTGWIEDPNKPGFFVPPATSPATTGTATTTEDTVTEDPAIVKLQDENKKILEEHKKQVDAASASMITAIQNQYDALIAEQKEANRSSEALRSTSLLMGGTSRYATGSEQSTMNQQIGYGLKQVSNLIAEENMAIAKAKQAAIDNDWKMAEKYMVQNDEAIKARREVLSDLAKSMADETKALALAKQKAEEDLTNFKEDILKEGAKTGNMTAEQKAAVMKGRDPGEVIAAAGDSLVTGTGIVGEYLYYKKQAELAGQTPLDFNAYQTLDANRKAKIAAAANAAGTDMTTKQQTVFNQIVNAQNKSPLIMANDRAVVLKKITDEVSADPTNSALQLSFIYSMVQALDTYQSAVREGEINLIQGTQGLGEKISNIPDQIQKGTLLAPSKIDEYVKVAKTLTNSIEKAANSKKNTFKAQAIANGIGKQWDEFQQTADALNASSVGDEVTQSEVDAKNKVIEYGKNNPDRREEIKGWMTTNQPDVGRPYTYAETLQILGK